MTESNSNPLSLLGKYISFNTTESLDRFGVVNSINFNIDGTVEISIGWDDHYKYSDLYNLKVLGEVTLYP
jgi:hypothetical protein